MLVIVDASSFIFRAFYAVRPLSNAAGVPTNATFGFATMILKVLEELKPEKLAIVYDTKHPSFRKERYAEYKANRSAMPDDLQPQIPYIKRFVEALGLPRFEKPGLEADDIIAALAQLGKEKASGEILIVSSDKDLMQLVDEKTFLIDTMKNVKIGTAGVREKMGVEPNQIIDYLGLVGDSSDNIPGVPGIGPKTAATLLKDHGTLEGIYEKIDSLKAGKLKDNLIQHRENAFLSKELATVRYDVGIDFDWDALSYKPVFGAEMQGLLKELEFAKFQDRLERLTKSAPKDQAASAPASSSLLVESQSPAPAAPVSADDKVAAHAPSYHLIQKLEDLEKALAKAAQADVLVIDTETTGLAHTDKLVGFSFCFGAKDAYYVPLRHDYGEQVELSDAVALWNRLLRGKKLAGQNLKFDLNVLRREGVEIDDSQVAFDTMLAAYVADPSGRHNMDQLSKKYLHHDTITYESVCGTGKNQKRFSEVDLGLATQYAAEDAHVTWLLKEEIGAELKRSPSLEKVLNTIDLPLVAVLSDMETRGVAIDKPLLANLSEEFANDLKNYEQQAFEIAGGEFNLASPKQLQEVLFERLKLPTFKKTKTGYSTDVDVLTKLAVIHPLPRVILQYREVAKLKSTYVDVLPEIADADSRVHTNYQQTVAATGRLSSSDPNLQNIPIRTELGKRIRAAFVARPGYLLVGADYSQIELRVLAELSGDALLKDAFQKGADIHTLTAARVFHVDEANVTSDLRRKAKAINFGLIYGKTAFSLAEELGISRAEASDIISVYFRQYPTIRTYLDGLAESAKAKGYAETLYGRRRPIEGINDRNKMVQAMAERMATNTPLQGTAADLMKLAMVRVHRELPKREMKSRMILQVHDELVLEVPENEVDAARALVKEMMEGVGRISGFPQFSVPLTVETGKGTNWLDLG